MTDPARRSRERAEQRRRDLAARQQQDARRKLLFRVLIPVALVAVVVAVLVIVKVAGGGSGGGNAPGVLASGAAPAAVVAGVTTIPVSTFNAVGIGAASVLPAGVDGDALTADGKPRILYVGAEYCPYCAAERWAVVAALSRFGTFTGLAQTNSSGSDVYPNTATLSFHGASFTSDVISFTGVETETVDQKPLETLSSADQAVFEKYDTAPYVASGNTGSIPFVDLGGKYLISGASYNPQLLQGKTHEQIAAALADAATDISQAVVGTANAITAAICRLTGAQPGAVCTSAGVQAAAQKLGS